MPARTRPLSLIAWALAAGTLAVPRASAEDSCAADVRQFCSDVRAGGPRLSTCLRENQARLSTSCREKLEADALAARRFVEEVGRACRSDVDRFCASVEPGGGRIFGCLAQHQLELSPSCESEVSRIAEARERIANIRSACAADVGRLCADVPPELGPILECLRANEARLSSGCSAADLRQAVEAGTLVDVMEEMSARDRVREALQIFQGLDSVAFSRSQVLLQFDSYERLKGQANASRLLFNPQFVFGEGRQFSLQLKVPVTTVYPDDAGARVQSGLGSVVTSFAWNFSAKGQMRHYLGLGVQWQTASTATTGGPWALVPSYAVAVSLARSVSLTTQVVWLRSVGSSAGYPELNLLQLEPILVFALPGRSFLALDTRLGEDFVSGTFVPLMKGVAGLFVDRQKSLSISSWYQASLTDAAVSQSFRYEVGLGLAYYFDW